MEVELHLEVPVVFQRQFNPLVTIAVAVYGAMLPGCDGHSLAEDCVSDSPAPQSLDDVTDRLTLLPEPSLPCYIASLPRPLSIVATDNIFSAQPADGRENPRVFILTEGLATSLVVDGPGQHLLEFGEWVSNRRTVKGEIAFPVDEHEPVDPYDLLYAKGQTRCSFCHLEEQEESTGRFSSLALQPPSYSLVPIQEIRAEHRNCRPNVTPERCAILHSLIDYGPLEEGHFGEDVDYIFE